MTTLKRVVEVVADPSTCAACGAKFSCGAALAECWCSQIPLSDEARAELRARYRECLCSECLRGLEDGRFSLRKDGNKEK